ncbi:MAG TPA: DUF397 domain-containing protein [Actinoallomurus sp.]|nr:DUF397 domain-containing protein [Actinoallomurus sp.]
MEMIKPWRKSTRSSANGGDCVELAVVVREGARGK